VRWFYFLLLVLLVLVLESGLMQLLWLPTRLGQVGPELLAVVVVFVALHVGTGAEAALAGWAAGMALDLTLSGEGMGLFSLAYALGGAGVWRVRGSFLREFATTQAVLTFLFCLFAYEGWMLFSLALNAGASGGPAWRHLLQALAVAVYSAVLAPLVCLLLKPLGPFIIAGYGQRDRR
jgi:cell shape-determining protein MreD